jgi:hypothetical protein
MKLHSEVEESFIHYMHYFYIFLSMVNLFKSVFIHARNYIKENSKKKIQEISRLFKRLNMKNYKKKTLHISCTNQNHVE